MMARWQEIIDDRQWSEAELAELPQVSIGRAPKFDGGYQVHPHTEIDGIDIDNALVPLIAGLWHAGFKTFACCQGNLVDYHVSLGYFGYGYILFVNFDDAVEFLRVTASAFTHDEGIYKITLACMEDGKATVQFPPALLDKITKTWVDRP